MKLIWILLGALGIALGLFVLAWLNAIRASWVRNSKLAKLIRPAIEAAQQNRPFAEDKIRQLAELPEARNMLFAELKEIGRAELFPTDYLSIEKVAESDLAHWLMHPNELGAAPSGMELIRGITIQEEEKRGTVFLFRFRAEPSTWASERGWMAGVAGPYWDNVGPPHSAAWTFSELTPFDEMTVDQHVDFLRAAWKKKGLVMPS